jgi:hypothetical protein
MSDESSDEKKCTGCGTEDAVLMPILADDKKIKGWLCPMCSLNMVWAHARNGTIMETESMYPWVECARIPFVVLASPMIKPGEDVPDPATVSVEEYLRSLLQHIHKTYRVITEQDRNFHELKRSYQRVLKDRT